MGGHDGRFARRSGLGSGTRRKNGFPVARHGDIEHSASPEPIPNERLFLAMLIDTLQPIKEAAGALPDDWLDRSALPPNTPTGLRYGQVWRNTPEDIRLQMVAQAQDPSELYVLWTWELDVGVRVEIVKALGRLADLPRTNVVLKKIFLEETPDEGGRAVRREAKTILVERAEREAQDERTRGVVRTRGAIRTRGAVRTRGVVTASGGTGRPPADRSARAILLEIEDLQAANPRFR